MAGTFTVLVRADGDRRGRGVRGPYSQLNTTSAEVNGLPSCHCTSFFSLQTMTLPSSRDPAALRLVANLPPGPGPGCRRHPTRRAARRRCASRPGPRFPRRSADRGGLRPATHSTFTRRCDPAWRPCSRTALALRDAGVQHAADRRRHPEREQDPTYSSRHLSFGRCINPASPALSTTSSWRCWSRR